MDNRLTLIEPTSKRDSAGSVIWKCQCSCGKHTEHVGCKVKNNQIRSCGCLRKSKNIERSGISALYTTYKYGASKRGIFFHLDIDDFTRLVKSNCHYCGTPPREQTKKSFMVNANGIDRKDSDVGYLIENCVPCCTTCNHAKGVMTYEVFIEWIIKVSLNLKQYR